MHKKLIAIILLVTIFSVGTIAAQTANPTTVRYRATFTSIWSQATHPHASGNLPGNAHWSKLIGGTHNETINFWQTGALASNGVKNVAESGYNAPLKNEISAVIGTGSADAILEGDALYTAAGTINMEFDVHSDFDRVTLITMIAPSPDWFVGVSGLPLRAENGAWLDEVTVPLYPYDAGTDSGVDYTSGNIVTNPAQLIANAQESGPFSANSLGTLTFTRLTGPSAITLNSVDAGQVGQPLLFFAATVLLGLITLQHVIRRKSSVR